MSFNLKGKQELMDVDLACQPRYHTEAGMLKLTFNVISASFNGKKDQLTRPCNFLFFLLTVIYQCITVVLINYAVYVMSKFSRLIR